MTDSLTYARALVVTTSITAVAIGVAGVGYLMQTREQAAVAAVQPSDDEPGFDCRTMGNRTCGSNVTDQAPGTYPAPDGGTYTVVLVDPYDHCVAAANLRGPSGFAGEVCEPLMPGFQHGIRIELGVVVGPDGSQSLPLAEDIARTCRDLAPACIRSVIDAHRVR